MVLFISVMLIDPLNDGLGNETIYAVHGGDDVVSMRTILKTELFSQFLRGPFKGDKPDVAGELDGVFGRDVVGDDSLQIGNVIRQRRQDKLRHVQSFEKLFRPS